LYDKRLDNKISYLDHEQGSNTNYCELKKFINGFSKKMSLNKDKAAVSVTPIDLLFGLKTDELRKQEIDFDFQNFKECVWAARTRGSTMSPKEIRVLMQNLSPNGDLKRKVQDIVAYD
jgi:hypothetical protein